MGKIFAGTEASGVFSLCTTGTSSPPYTQDSYVVAQNRHTTEFGYVISGKGTITCNGKKYSLKAGDLYHLPKGCNSKTFPDTDDPWSTIWINVFGDLIPNIMSAYRMKEITYFPAVDCYPLFEEIINLYRNSPLPVEEKGLKTSLMLHEIIQYLYVMSDASQITQKHSDAYIIKAYLDNHMHENVKTSDLAELVYRSESQAIRIFKRSYNITPYNYLMKIRLAAAHQLLEQTNLSIKSIAFSLGFSDEHYFSHLFKLKTGKSPLAYRKETQKK